MSIAEKLTQIAENEQKVYEAGKQAEYDRFWDEYQQNGGRTDYRGAFCGAGWTEETLLPKYSVKPVRAAYMFDSCKYEGDLDNLFKNRGLELDFSGCNDMASLFFQTRIVKVGTIDCSKVSATNNIASVFNSEFLRVVRNFIPPKVAMAASCFQLNLETFNVGGTITKSINLSRCSKLKDASVQSIIDNLADLTGQTAQTVNFHSTVVDKLTVEQYDAITAKNWTI